MKLSTLITEFRQVIEFVNNHAEIIIGNKRAFLEAEDVDKVKHLRWSAHPRGPINEQTISKNPRRKKYTLMCRLLYPGRRVSFIDGNRFDLRRANVTDKEYRPTSALRKTKQGGIYYYARKKRWFAQARYRGKTFRRSFSVNRYGDLDAERLARQARAEMEKHGIHGAIVRMVQYRRLPKARAKNELRSAPIPESDNILNLAKLYAEREGLPDDMVPHLHRMILLGGGRMPKMENTKDLAPINIYEGNQEYENCQVEVERDEETKAAQGFQYPDWM